ncbi:MAG: hypothetical protein V7784_09820 [Oceanospirillaceae bacterium]
MKLYWQKQLSTTFIIVTVTIVLLIVPIAAGLIGTWLPAMGYLPSAGYDGFNWQPLIALYSHPSTLTSITLSISSALLATCSAFIISQWLCMQLYHSRSWRWLKHALAPLLAIPHLAFALGFSFIIAPSGWLMRVISPQLSGFEIPPDWLIVNDNYALSLSLALIIKEIPFFLLMTLAAMNNFNVNKTLQVGATLNYPHNQAWIKLVFPQLYGQLRLPLYAVLSYSLSVVDLSIVLGPNAPATFSVLINQWFNDPDFTMRLIGASAASMLLVIVMVFIGLFYLAEVLLKKYLKNWLVAGADSSNAFELPAKVCAYIALFIISASSFLSIAALVVWSFSRQWRFPDLLPALWSIKNWQKSWGQLTEPLFNTALIGISSGFLALVVCIAVLQWQSQLSVKRANNYSWIIWLVYVPILIPQISFMFGIQVMLISMNLDGHMMTMIWMHLLFVLPYCYLSLAKVYLQFDDRYLQVGAVLSQSMWRSFCFVKVPMLFKPLAFSFAVGFAVSVSQYLPSLYVGAGRIETITLQSVAAASGSDNRISAVFGFWQFVLPLIVYFAALAIPQLCFIRRRGL